MDFSIAVLYRRRPTDFLVIPFVEILVPCLTAENASVSSCGTYISLWFSNYLNKGLSSNVFGGPIRKREITWLNSFVL
jgi:hypothetical protein